MNLLTEKKQLRGLVTESLLPGGYYCTLNAGDISKVMDAASLRSVIKDDGIAYKHTDILDVLDNKKPGEVVLFAQANGIDRRGATLLANFFSLTSFSDTNSYRIAEGLQWKVPVFSKKAKADDNFTTCESTEIPADNIGLYASFTAMLDTDKMLVGKIKS